MDVRNARESDLRSVDPSLVHLDAPRGGGSRRRQVGDYSHVESLGGDEREGERSDDEGDESHAVGVAVEEW